MCPLWLHRTNLVFARGRLPCDVLFIGEAPGPSEDMIGLPFIGPAGKELDRWIAEATDLEPRWASLRIAYTNLLSCIPIAQEGGKFSSPPEKSVVACASRLSEFIKLAQPRLLVCVGNEARDWLDRKRYKGPYPTEITDIPQVAIIHPAAVLRDNEASRGLRRQKAIVTLVGALEEFPCQA